MWLKRCSLPGHGCGGYWDVELAGSTYGQFVRVSLGGYGWLRPWWHPGYRTYPYVAHLRFGPLCLSLGWRR